MEVIRWRCSGDRLVSTSTWIALTIGLSSAGEPLVPFCIERYRNATSSPEISLMILRSSLPSYSGAEKSSHPRQTVCSANSNCQIHMPCLVACSHGLNCVTRLDALTEDSNRMYGYRIRPDAILARHPSCWLTNRGTYTCRSKNVLSLMAAQSIGGYVV